MSETIHPEASPLAPSPRRKTKPMVRGALPIIGHAFAFGRDPDGFVASCRARYGDVFRMKMPGGERTFLLDPFDYPTVFAEERLRFQESGAEIGGRVFGYPPEKAMDPKYHELSVITSRDMRGDLLQVMSERMQTIFIRRVTDEVSASGIDRPLLALLSEHFFAAGIDAIFGDGFYSKKLYDDYAVVDRHFAAAVAGIPPFLLPGLVRARTELARSLSSFAPNHAAMLDARHEFFDRAGVEPELRGAFDAGVLWASQANTVVAAFWTLYYLLRDQKARSAVSEEVRSIAGPVGDPRACDPLSRDALRRLVLLDSACSEAMRLSSGPMNGRRATESFELPLASGESLPLEAGEDILLYPRHTHFDAAIFEAPEEFRFDRFVDEKGRSARFELRGRRLTMPFLPFGGGMSMCPGRFFARNEIKVLVATMLVWLDTELLPVDEPALDFSRIGLGVLPPKHDVTVRLRRRA